MEHFFSVEHLATILYVNGFNHDNKNVSNFSLYKLVFTCCRSGSDKLVQRMLETTNLRRLKPLLT